MVFFLICYFFTKKASVFLEDNKTIRQRMRTTMWIAMTAVILSSLIEALILSKDGLKLANLCKTIYFIAPNTVNSVVNAVFIIIGIKITQSIYEFNSG